jgi:hypothetical protein
MVILKIDAKALGITGQKLVNLDKDMRKIVAKSINKGLTEGKPMAEGLITGRYNIGAPNLGIKRATAATLSGDLKGTGGMLPVSQFGPSTAGKVVSVTILRGNRKAITPGSRGPGISGAFMVGGRVMERRQPERYPIFPVMTIGIPQMLGSKAVSNPTREFMGKVSSSEYGKLVVKAIK